MQKRKNANTLLTLLTISVLDIYNSREYSPGNGQTFTVLETKRFALVWFGLPNWSQQRITGLSFLTGSFAMAVLMLLEQLVGFWN